MMKNEKLKSMMALAGLDDFLVFGRVESKDDVVSNFAYLIMVECCKIMFTQLESNQTVDTNELIKTIKKEMGFYD